MVARGKTLATAESCTSGRIAAALTAVSGASGYFQGGLVAYQDRVKTELLGVRATDIERHDVVSREVVEQMVRGACTLLRSDYAIASTGYAEGGSARVAAGTIWIGWGSADEVHSRCLHLTGMREENTQTAVECALEEFLEEISKKC